MYDCSEPCSPIVRWRSLQTLRLHVLGPCEGDDNDYVSWDSCFPIFLSNFPNLVDLTLEVNTYDIPTLTRAIHDLPVFTKLRRLTLALAANNYAHLLKYLGKYKTLDKLALCAVILLGADERRSAWSYFLTALPKILDLQRMEIFAPFQVQGLVREDVDDILECHVVDWQKEARKLILEQPGLGAKLERAVESISVRQGWHGSEFECSWSDDDSTYDSDREPGVSNDISWTDSS